jgi:prepilin-type N-terminal cleavage/methylation domain-containing protein
MRGFSLLEMLVVLVLLGLAAGLIAPSLSRTADRVQAAMASQAGRPFRWEAGSLVERPGLVWPAGWRVVALTPLELAANGWCEGAQLQAQGAGLSMRLEALAPDCRVVELTDAP